MKTSTLTCIGFVHSLNKNYTEAVDTYHKALGQNREDSFSSTMLTLVLEMCIENQHICNDFLDDASEIVTGEESKKPTKVEKGVLLNDDNDVVVPFRNPKLRLWNKKLRKKTDDSNNSQEDDSSAMVIDSTSSVVESSSCSMDLSTNMSSNSDAFK